MPAYLLNVIRDMYEEDKCILVDGVKRAHVQPSDGVKQGCHSQNPLSPLLSSLHNDKISREVSQGVDGALMVR